MDDAALRNLVIEALDFEPSLDAARIGVSAHEGVVTLHGTVASLQEKWTAERVAREVRGVRGLAADIEVVLPYEKKTADEEIARRALNVMRWDECVPDDRILVQVEGGIVTLTGTVDHYYQKQETELLIRRLGGVRGVYNDIIVQPSRDARGVRETIERALRRTAELDADGITIRVEGATVHLDGHVRSWRERHAAEAAAWSAPGVARVDDQLMVQAGS